LLCYATLLCLRFFKTTSALNWCLFVSLDIDLTNRANPGSGTALAVVYSVQARRTSRLNRRNRGSDEVRNAVLIVH
jgi:hypothetical protein